MKQLRRIRLPGKGGKPPPRKSETTITIEQSHSRQIRELPEHQLRMVVRSIKEGINVGRIAAHFEANGWLSVKASTFVQYLHAFKRLEHRYIEEFETEGIDDFVEGGQPSLDEEVVLEQMIRLQSRRLRIGHKFEKDSGLLNPVLHKDIAAVGELAERLGKLRGKTVGAGRPEKNPVTMPTDTRENLSRIERDEAIQSRLVSTLGRLASMVQARDDSK